MKHDDAEAHNSEVTTRKSKRNSKRQIGEIGVDAGLCWLGDPCNILHADPAPKAIGKDWNEFCEIVHNDRDFYAGGKQLEYD